MSEKQEAAKHTLATIRQAFESVEWIEFGKPFWTAQVHLGEQDRVEIVVVSGDVLTTVLRQLASLEGLRHHFEGIEDPAQIADALAAVLAEADTTLWRNVIEPLFTACVRTVECPELRATLSLELDLPGADADPEVRVSYVRSLPIVLTARVLIGIAVQAGNLLTRSTKN